MFKNTLRGFPKARTKLELAKIVVASCKFQIAESNDDSLKWKWKIIPKQQIQLLHFFH